jgi:hypothetical protein
MPSTAPLRLMLYDATCKGRGLSPGLSLSWRVGGQLYRALDRLDDWQGVSTWEEGLAWLAEVEPGRPISEIQYWGHGKWGAIFMDRTPLGASALEPGHPHHGALSAIRERLVPGGRALWWFRTCETFGGHAGHHFAKAWTRFFHCRAAGHTFIIGPWQSGLHALSPGEAPHWPADEGLLEGTPAAPRRARWSTPWAPGTITCLHGTLPQACCGGVPCP